MTKVDFNKTVNRYGTYSTQWDYVKDRFVEENLLHFTISDMDFRSPKGVSDVLVSVAERGVFGYTRWNNPEFKGAISKWFKERYYNQIDEDAIVYSPSVIFSLAKLVDHWSEPNGTVLTLSPCYDAFINTVTANDRRLVQADISNGLDLDVLRQSFIVNKPDIFLLCNPHNPLGYAWTDSQMRSFVDLCNDYRVAVISDEIHMDVLRAGIKGHSLAEYFSILDVNKAVITSASKSFNIPALGCSYALIPDELERQKFLRMLKQENALSSVPYLGMLATIECYNNQSDWLDQLSAYLDNNFAFMQKFLKEKLDYDYTIPDATYLGWLDITQMGVKMEPLQKALIYEQGVAIMDGRIYGQGGKNHLRFNLGAPISKIEDGLVRLERAVKSVKK